MSDFSERPTLAQRLLTSRLAYCALLAAFMVGTRLVCFDWEMFFKPRYLPNHDMSAALPFFVTNAHSMRETGDLAWWNPITYEGHGYPQYYQSFLSPMAPTAGHVTFMVWMQVVYLFGQIGIRIPEYYQYLVFTYILLPFLAILSFSWFTSHIFRRRVTITLVTVAFTLSGIGLWNSAWFYFQEPATLFFLLGAAIAATQRPSLPRGIALLAAVLIQVASLNYWTVYNSWFVVILLGSYAILHRGRVATACRAALEWTANNRRLAGGLAALFVGVAATWLLLIASVVREQGAKWVRNTGSASDSQEAYAKEQARGRVQATRWFTLELFNPTLRRATTFYKFCNEMHHARYLGLSLLPLLLLFPFFRWGRSESWLAISAAAVFCVCLAPPFLLSLWELQPGMNRIRHLFYFYTHYWQLLLVLLAGAVFDRLLQPRQRALRTRMIFVVGGLIGTAALTLLIVNGFSEHYPANSPSLEAITLSGVLLLISSGVLLQLCLRKDNRSHSLFAWAVVGVCFCDLSRYFAEANRADHLFTRTEHLQHVPFPLPPETVSAMRRPWNHPDNADFVAWARNLPIRTELWPDNHFLLPRPIWTVLHSSVTGLLTPDAPVRFYRQAESLDDDHQLRRAIAAPERFYDTLCLSGNERVVQAPQSAGLPVDMAVRFERSGYNDWRFSLTVPEDGWLSLHQLYDSNWHISIDKQLTHATSANIIRMAVPITGGAHTIEMSFRPLSRRLYWPACWLLEGTLAFSVVVAWRKQPRLKSLLLPDSCRQWNAA